MGITDFLSSAMEYLNLSDTVYAEAAEKEEEESSKDEDGDDKKEGGDDEEKEEGGDEAEAEEEEEPVDPKPQLEEECAKSHQCRGYKHHFDECVERVTAQQEHPDEYKGPKEDCVEEFFHLQHCATGCAAPKLFHQLK